MKTIVLSLTLALASAAFADEYTPLEILTVEDGEVRLNNLSASTCISFNAPVFVIAGITIRGGFGITTHSSKWQRRDNVENPWTDIPDKNSEAHEVICAYSVLSYSPTEPGEYRLVAEISIDGERGKYASANILIVSQEGEVTSRPAEEPAEEPTEEPETTAVEAVTWGFLKSRVAP